MTYCAIFTFYMTNSQSTGVFYTLTKVYTAFVLFKALSLFTSCDNDIIQLPLLLTEIFT